MNLFAQNRFYGLNWQIPVEIQSHMWHILEWGANHAYKIYDFGGAGKPDEEYGVRDFKAKFGGTLVNYGRNKCIHSPLAMKFSEYGYSLLRKFL